MRVFSGGQQQNKKVIRTFVKEEKNLWRRVRDGSTRTEFEDNEEGQRGR